MSGRKRFVAVGNKWVEVPEDYAPEPPRADYLLYNDRLYQDDGDSRYNSRAEHREYMRRNDLTTSDDWTDSWAKAAKERAAFFTEGRDPSRRQDVARAMELNNSRRK